jgi:cell division protein FtsB
MPNDPGGSESVRLRLLPFRSFKLGRPQLTGRSMVITAMALFLVVLLASPLQTYLNRRDTLSAQRRQQVQLAQQVAALEKQSAQWNDPAFIEREARVRLQYVRPGDTLYSVLNADGSVRSEAKSSVGVLPKAQKASWNTTLWSSVQDIDSAP